MDFFDLIEKRSSVRSYQDREISEDKLQKLLQAANSAPSAGNLQAYEMVVVKKEEIKQELAMAAYNQQFIKEAPVSVVFLLDPDRSSRKYGSRGEELYTIQDSSIAATFLMLAAFEMNMGSCWIGAFQEEDVKNALDINKRPVAIITLGYTSDKRTNTSRRELEDIVTYRE